MVATDRRNVGAQAIAPPNAAISTAWTGRAQVIVSNAAGSIRKGTSGREMLEGGARGRQGAIRAANARARDIEFSLEVGSREKADYAREARHKLN
jgi:hypothetical protein